MYETEIWQQNVAKNVIKNNAAIAALVSLFIDKGIMTIDEFKKLREEALAMEPYASALKRIDGNIAQYEKLKSGDYELRDLLTNLFGGKQDKANEKFFDCEAE